MARAPINAFMAGMTVSALASSVHIFHSNAVISARVTPLIKAGRLVVPNERVLDALSSPLPALAGAVFFVLTAGIFITGTAIVSQELIHRGITHKFKNRTHARITNYRLAAIAYLCPWAVATLILNYSCFSWIAATHTLVIPLVVQYFLGKKSDKPLSSQGKNHRLSWFILALVITGSCFVIKGDRGMFLRTRDYLLLPNRPGQAISQWYYTYSPHAAEALKPSMATGSSVDTMAVFRSFCLSGLMAGLPLFLFGTFFLGIGAILSRIMAPEAADASAAIVATALAISLLFYLTPMEIGTDPKSLEQGLEGPSPRVRIEILRVIVHNRSDIFDFLSRETMDRLARGTVPEQYWLANALGVSPDKQSIPVLLRLANKEAINLQCAALKALSKKGCGLSRKILRDKIKESPDWYVQLTALGALKGLRCK